MAHDEDEALWVESTRGPDDEPVCLFTWGPHQWYADVSDVRSAAVDLVSCAAYAEMAMLMATTMNLSGMTVSRMLGALIASTGRVQFGNENTLDLVPAGSTKSGEAVVLLRRGRQRGDILAQTARGMALQWFETAEATESDQLVTEAMRGTHFEPDQIERVFGYLRELRKEKP